MSQAQSTATQKPTISWDDETADNDEGFALENLQAADVPKACSIDSPECEACQ
jgi:hypothetical protein